MRGQPSEDEFTALEAVPWIAKIGNVGRCRSCNARIVWCTTTSGKRAPVNPNGISQLRHVPDANDHRQGGLF